MTELPFNTPEFADAWSDWLEYKRLEFKFKFKSEQSMKASLKRLKRLSGNNEEIAILMLEKAMSCGYRGFFALKDHEKPQTKEPTTLAGQMLKKYGVSS